MTAKYKMPEKHTHSELIKAWADGAIVQVQNSVGNWIHTTTISWGSYNKYRIDPTCDYALAKIAKVACRSMVELYICWLNGGELELDLSNNGYPIAAPNDDPFSQYLSILDEYGGVRRKRRIAKQVLWVLVEVNNTQPDYYNEQWEPIGSSPDITIGEVWCEVPAMTREVEVDG